MGSSFPGVQSFAGCAPTSLIISQEKAPMWAQHMGACQEVGSEPIP